MWNPHLEKDIQCLEKVQQFALRMCAKDYHATYENLLDLFFVPSLRNRRLCLSLCTFYCFVNGLVHFPQQNLVHPIMSSTRNFNPHAFIVPYSRCNALKFSFFCTVIRLWNCLPHTSEHLLQFKHHISPFFCPLKYLFMFYGALYISIYYIVYRALLCRISIKN